MAGRLANSTRHHRSRALRTDVPAHPKNNVVEWMSITVPPASRRTPGSRRSRSGPSIRRSTHHICLGFNPHTPDIKYFEPYGRTSRATRRERDSRQGPTFGPATPGRPLPQHGGGLLPARESGCRLPRLSMPQSWFGPAAISLSICTTRPMEQPSRTSTDRIHSRERAARAPLCFVDAPPLPPTRSISPFRPTIGNWQSPPAEVTFNQDVELVYMMPHMHVRGKDMTYTLMYPDGRKEIVLSVPHYDFNWQLGYNTSDQSSQGHQTARGRALRQLAPTTSGIRIPTRPFITAR